MHRICKRIVDFFQAEFAENSLAWRSPNGIHMTRNVAHDLLIWKKSFRTERTLQKIKNKNLNLLELISELNHLEWHWKQSHRIPFNCRFRFSVVVPIQIDPIASVLGVVKILSQLLLPMLSAFRFIALPSSSNWIGGFGVEPDSFRFRLFPDEEVLYPLASAYAAYDSKLGMSEPAPRILSGNKSIPVAGRAFV